ncbi:MAG TPA: hypothetical protein VNS12_06070 [Pelagibacterium sp.]|uniref:hypothetical protein n=1 Tax=Pelagibacterium sp. TaxID=1967288 RepID=UPI002C7DF2A7|nr:hypothetical protein [Pelagibacterium sp.]HWJ87616.1 hypothetical protein [Pelagibacterium sp.]
MAPNENDGPTAAPPSDPLAFARMLARATGYGDDVARYIVHRALGSLPHIGGTA